MPKKKHKLQKKPSPPPVQNSKKEEKVEVKLSAAIHDPTPNPRYIKNVSDSKNYNSGKHLVILASIRTDEHLQIQRSFVFRDDNAPVIKIIITGEKSFQFANQIQLAALEVKEQRLMELEDTFKFPPPADILEQKTLDAFERLLYPKEAEIKESIAQPKAPRSFMVQREETSRTVVYLRNYSVTDLEDITSKINTSGKIETKLAVEQNLLWPIVYQIILSDLQRDEVLNRLSEEERNLFHPGERKKIFSELAKILLLSEKKFKVNLSFAADDTPLIHFGIITDFSLYHAQRLCDCIAEFIRQNPELNGINVLFAQTETKDYSSVVIRGHINKEDCIRLVAFVKKFHALSAMSENIQEQPLFVHLDGHKPGIFEFIIDGDLENVHRKEAKHGQDYAKKITNKLIKKERKERWHQEQKNPPPIEKDATKHSMMHESVRPILFAYLEKVGISYVVFDEIRDLELPLRPELHALQEKIVYSREPVTGFIIHDEPLRCAMLIQIINFLLLQVRSLNLGDGTKIKFKIVLSEEKIFARYTLKPNQFLRLQDKLKEHALPIKIDPKSYTMI